MPARGLDGLEHAPVEANGLAARAERDPVELDGRLVSMRHPVKRRRFRACRHPGSAPPSVRIFYGCEPEREARARLRHRPAPRQLLRRSPRTRSPGERPLAESVTTT